MELTIKQLAQNSKVFVPQTVAEAVLVKKQEQVETLDQVLDQKIEGVIAPAGSGLIATPFGNSVIISHTSEIDVTNNTEPQPLLIQHDSRGHIISTKAVGKLIVNVDGSTILTADGYQDQALNFGSNFGMNTDKQVTLKWTQL